MAEDFEVRGSQQLAVLGRRLKEAGEGGLRRQLLAGIRKSGQKVIPDVEESARTRLPKSGGLAARVAGQRFAVRTSLTGSGARVRLTGLGMKELRDINRGRLRHPVWGNRNRWVPQDVEPGFFDDPIEARAPEIRKDIQQVMGDVARQITRRF